MRKRPAQPALFEYAKEPIRTCAFGAPWPCGGTARPGCPGCRRFCADAIRAFRAAVRAGTYNRAGYTRAEWARAGRSPDTWTDAPAVRRAFSRTALVLDRSDPHAAHV
jgi:hypothetical protein